MNRRFLILLLAALAPLAPPGSAAGPPAPGPAVIVVTGAAGEDRYAGEFAAQTAAWEKTSAAAGARTLVIGRAAPTDTPDRAQLENALAAEPRETPEPLTLVLIGHGTFDTQDARFNLRGDDMTASELASWLQPFRRPLAIINTSSASAPFLRTLSAPGRIIVTATRTGSERNYTRFGASLASSLADPSADLDQDGQISLLEAFLAASARVAEFYKAEGRLATEHALLDDNGDGLGTPASWFRGLHASKKPKDAAALDGLRAHQWLLTQDPDSASQPAEWRTRRDALETSLATLREKKTTLPPDDYSHQLESLLLELARHYEALDSKK